ncbi:MAG: hypothetical protein AAF902_20655 [Chloroflexota bacterium]
MKEQMKTITTCIVTVFLLMMLSACGNADQTAAIPAVEQTQFLQAPEDMRNFRYCEIIPVFRSGTTFNLEVYNTIGLNDCPDEAWGELDEEDMADAFDAVQVIANGPRFWLVNEVVAGDAMIEGHVSDFGGIEMRQVAMIETQLSGGMVGETFYEANEVQRTTTFIFYAGDMVYELISPEGDVYRMQSYTHQVDPTLTIDDLEMLGDRLSLPEGWRYQARVLSEGSQMVADGLAFVLNDEFLNAYQKVTEPGS